MKFSERSGWQKELDFGGNSNHNPALVEVCALWVLLIFHNSSLFDFKHAVHISYT